MTLSFKHSGRLGDIVYALPLVKAMCKRTGTKADFFVMNDAAIDPKKSVYHPGGNLCVNQALYDYLSPLLAIQPYINSVKYVSHPELPQDTIDLDSFKHAGLNLLASSNQVWYRKMFGIPVPLELPWIELSEPTAPIVQSRLLVNKSTRFYNKSINYAFLDEIKESSLIYSFYATTSRHSGCVV